ncbi:RHS repeat-associated core domain-containing protein [Pokkaliibacter sp. MBI-7]|uniref:RHS repeat-associated core domain-containing protein n=1 Tax=Pokkaliibacter sp. MBI-7 TaxID=3040600 RepID=UPI002447BD45|nr:RHS repeat-associated core domain-containing protein [Pokkaliibacter sp. MBI-7]MDH2433012.1 RHS repeat-associated core domain-containing protein [Pokkaliibacter sp. MBI-7]
MRVLMTRFLASVLALLLIWQPAVAGITYYHNDALGSPVAATDENGKLLWHEAYAPFGEKLNNAPAQGDSRIAYTGKLHDDDTGLTYMNARYYDPVVGRFMAIDPVGPVQGGVKYTNRYSYGENNPYKYFDPTGMSLEIEGSRDFTDKALKDVEDFRETDVGAQILSDIEKSKMPVTIKEYKNKNDLNQAITTPTDLNLAGSPSGVPTSGSPSEIQYNPDWSPVVNTTLGNLATPFSVVLGHELVHAHNALFGGYHVREDPVKGLRIDKTREEVATIKVENTVKKEMGLPERINGTIVAP